MSNIDGLVYLHDLVGRALAEANEKVAKLEKQNVELQAKLAAALGAVK